MTGLVRARGTRVEVPAHKNKWLVRARGTRVEVPAHKNKWQVQGVGSTQARASVPEAAP